MKLLKSEGMPSPHQDKLDTLNNRLNYLSILISIIKIEVNSNYGIGGGQDKNKLISKRFDAYNEIKEINKQIPILERIIERDNTIKEILS